MTENRTIINLNQVEVLHCHNAKSGLAKSKSMKESNFWVLPYASLKKTEVIGYKPWNKKAYNQLFFDFYFFHLHL